MKLNELYTLAEQQNITVENFTMNNNKALAALIDRSFFIAMNQNKIENELEEKMCLSHEIGHCESGAMYMAKSKYETIGRCEARALRWQITHLIPENELNEAIDKGYIESWQLAEYFNISEQLVREAVHYYKEVI